MALLANYRQLGNLLSFDLGPFFGPGVEGAAICWSQRTKAHLLPCGLGHFFGPRFEGAATFFEPKNESAFASM